MIALRGKFERSEDGSPPAAISWKLKGHWAFGNEVPAIAPKHGPTVAAAANAASVPSNVKPTVCLPFVYKFDRVVAPDQVELPNVDTTTTTTTVEHQVDRSDLPKQQQSSNRGPEEKESSLSVPANSGNNAGKKRGEQQTTEEDADRKMGGEATPEAKEAPAVGVSIRESASSETTKHASTRGNAPPKEQNKNNDSSAKPEAEKSTSKRKQTFADKTNPNDPDFTDACTKHNKDKVPPSGSWIGYFEAATGKKGPNMRIHEKFFLFLNATPAEDARTRFPDEALVSPTTVPASGTNTTAERMGTPEPGVLPPGHVHARGMGKNQYGTFELVGSFDLESGTLNLQRMYVITPESSRQRSSPRGGRGRGRRPSLSGDASSESRPTRKRQLSWKQRAVFEDETALAEGRQPQRRRSGVGGGPGRKRLRVDATTSVTFDTAASVLSSSTPTPVGGVVAPVAPAATTTPISTAVMPPISTAAAASIAPSILPATVAGLATGAIANIPIAPPLVVAPPTVIGAPLRETTAGPRKNRVGATAASTGSVTQRTGSSSTTTGPSSGGGGTVLRLPAAGDPKKARWRAAHFLYYQRPEPVGDDASTASGGKSGGAGTNTASAAVVAGNQQVKYVVYEGEMINAMRDGRGICLYSNGMLYEGEWKNDKEHGIGKLMSANRKRVIYRGEFQNGRIHGNGIYYYYPHTPSSSQARKGGKKVSIEEEQHEGSSSAATKIQSRYEGEFKECLRNGTGVYYLPDGSVYNGSFQNNHFSGKGIFTWPDGSVYDGEWKDGKRHGLGLLRASNGFTYDGSWIDNAMEGRGSATYPDGQQYNGLFSQGRREGRGTILFTNGAVYEGRFRDDAIDGQGTMKMGSTMVVPRTGSQTQLSNEGESTENDDDDNNNDNSDVVEDDDDKLDFMIPVSFQSDIGHIHRKAGFTHTGK